MIEPLIMAELPSHKLFAQRTFPSTTPLMQQSIAVTSPSTLAERSIVAVPFTKKSPVCIPVKRNAPKTIIYPKFEILTISSNHVACMPGSKKLECTVSRTDITELLYQWQESPDNVSWVDIAGATQSEYLPPSGLDKGLYFYRVKVKNICQNELDSDVITVEVKPCNVLINPGFRSRVQNP